eukprot:CAMPEP_0195086948 /NCGR_PEP_ID=MMETSP0448-20130528/26932_1 /TAXON_ID=66468 /ORGANISM="Heterocapsa triquestra, Strain CCMP 448" /LENGTH=48 /DNA_ID= /DNA_START= /DNA_END= /DNA_ORIENTATION=
MTKSIMYNGSRPRFLSWVMSSQVGRASNAVTISLAMGRPVRSNSTLNP